MKRANRKTESNAKSKIEKAVAEFNKYRSPEATAKLISAGNGKLEVEFTGHFCRTCGFYDYFDDFLITLEEMGIRVKRDHVKEFEGGALVKFLIAR